MWAKAEFPFSYVILSREIGFLNAYHTHLNILLWKLRDQEGEKTQLLILGFGLVAEENIR